MAEREGSPTDKAGTWQYRVVRATRRGETTFNIVMIYFGSDGMAEKVSRQPLPPPSIEVDLLENHLRFMLEACRKPWIDEKHIRDLAVTDSYW